MTQGPGLLYNKIQNYPQATPSRAPQFWQDSIAHASQSKASKWWNQPACDKADGTHWLDHTLKICNQLVVEKLPLIFNLEEEEDNMGGGVGHQYILFHDKLMQMWMKHADLKSSRCNSVVFSSNNHNNKEIKEGFGDIS